MNRKIIIAAIGFVIAVAIGLHFWAEWEKARFDASLPTPPTEEQQVIDETADDTAGDTAGGHWHGDEWHAEPHTGFVMPINEVDFSVQPTASTEPPVELADILATPKYVERLRVIRSIGRHDPEWAEWAEEDLWLEAEGELLEREEPYSTPKGGESREEIETLVRERLLWINGMTEEERLALAEGIEAYGRKREAWFERRKAHSAKMPLSQAAAEILSSGEDN